MLELVEGRDVAIIGTVYKDMKMKPSILDEYTKVLPAGRPRAKPPLIFSPACLVALRACMQLFRGSVMLLQPLTARGLSGQHPDTL